MNPFYRGIGHADKGELSTGGWANPEDINALLKLSLSWVFNPGEEAQQGQPLRHYHKGCIFLGETDDADSLPIGWKDDKHIVTVAGSRAGKGRSAIIPNLLIYTGSVVCIDPKGENARITAEQRAAPVSQGGLGQEVYVLDPFKVSGVPDRFQATFNPFWSIDLNDIDGLEQVSALADSIVVPTDPKDAHWDSSARDLIEAIILHVLTWPRYHDRRNLSTVRELLINGDPDALTVPASSGQPQIVFPSGITGGAGAKDMDVLLESMLKNTACAGVVSGQARNLLNMGQEERGSVLSTARRNTKFLDGTAIPANLEKSKHNLTMRRFRLAKRGATVYLCLPARYMTTHSRWLRLFLNALMGEVESTPPAKKVPILAILDEFPILGYMSKLESAIGFMAGFGLKIWTILQDINQIKRDYPNSWETFLGNAGVCQYFGNSDRSTLEYVSQNLGEVEVAPVVETTVVLEQASKARLSDEDFKLRMKKLSFLARATAEESDFVQNTMTTGKQTTMAPQLMKTALMTPDEIGREFSRYSQRQLVVTHDLRPMCLRRVNYDGRSVKSYWSKLNSK